MKKKSSLILKICIITLMIILSTIGIVWAVNKTVHVTGITENESYYDAYKVEVSFPDTYEGKEIVDKVKAFVYNNREFPFATNGETVNIVSQLFIKLNDRSRILCCQAGTALTDGDGYTANAYYVEHGSPAQSYILANLGELPEYGNKEKTDVQWAWWHLINVLGIKGEFEEKINGNTFIGMLPENDISGTSNNQGWNQLDFNYYNNLEKEFGSDRTITQEVFESELLKYKEEIGIDDIKDDDYKKIIEYVSFAFQPGRDLVLRYIGNLSLPRTDVYYEGSADGHPAQAKQYKEIAKSTLNENIKNLNEILNEKSGSYLCDMNKVGESSVLKGKKGVNYRVYGLKKVESIFKDYNITEANKKIEIYRNIYNILKKVNLSFSNVFIAGSNYNGQSNDLYTQAAQYEAFYNQLKNNKEISMNTDKMQVNFNSELNAYVVGPIKLKYFGGNTIYTRVSDFYIDVDGKRIKNNYTKGDKITEALNYNTYALVNKNMELYKNSGYFPTSGDEFYVVFTAGKGQNQITQLGFKHEYMAHESSYMFYKLFYNGVDMQDLAEAHSAHLWWQPTELRIEFDIPRSLTIEKKVTNEQNDIITSDKTFYFKVYDQAVTDETIEELILDDGTHTGARLYDIIAVEGNSKATRKLLSYKKSEWPDGAPKTYTVEVDARGHRFIQYGDWDCFETDSIWRDYRPENNTGIYEQNYVESSYVRQDVINNEIKKHFHLSVDKRISENDAKEIFYAKLYLTVNGKTDTYILPLQPVNDKTGYDLRCPDGPNKDGLYVCSIVDKGRGNFGTVETGEFEDGYLHAKWFAQLDGYSSYQVSYKVEEVDNNFLSYSKEEAEKDGSFWNRYYSPKYKNVSGKVEACNCGSDNDQKSSNAVITNNRDKAIEVNIELSKILKDENKSEIETEDEYKFDVTMLKSEPDTSIKENILDKQTISVKANKSDKKEFKSKLYPLNGNKYYLVIEEQGSYAKWIEVIKKFGPETWNLVEENGKITKIWTEINLSSKKFSSGFMNVNEYIINSNAFTIKKQVGDSKETKRYFEENPDKEFVFEIQTNRYSSISLDNFAKSDVEAGYVKLNEKTGKINVIINKDNFENGVTTELIKWRANESAPVYDIYEIDEHGNTYLQWIELGPNRPEKSIFDEFTPQDGGQYQINLMDFTNPINVQFINNSYEVLLKKIVMTNGEDKTAEFFEKLPDAHFDFKFYDNNNNDVTSKYFDTENGVIVIDKDNYENGVLSNKISKTLGKEYKFVEIFDGNEENLYENDKVFPVVFGENNLVVVEAENIVEKVLVVDKVVEELDGDDFLDGEAFFFKVYENKEDVTRDLFEEVNENGYIVVSKTEHDNGGVKSDVIYGDHTYTIVEYDDKGYEWNNKEKSDSYYWDKFTPSNDGKWEITLSTDKGPSLVEAVNYIKTNITIEKELVGENIKDSDKDIDFTATLLITPSEGTDWMMISNNPYPTKTLPQYYDKAIKVSVNKSYSLDGIYWKGEAPIAQVLENTDSIPEGWELVGYRINDEFYPNSVPIQLKGGEHITFVIQNEKYTDEFKIPVTKTMVDQNGIPTSVNEDMTFLFDIYVENKAGEYKGNSISSYEQGKYSDGKYVKIDRLEVSIPAGSSQGNAETDIINVNGGSTLDYKVVEVDENENSFADYNNEENSYWDTFEPTTYSNGKWGSKTGIWTGTLSNKNPTSSVAKVDAYNKVTNVKIDLDKFVIKDGKLQEIERGEIFKFKAKFTSDYREEIDATFMISYDRKINSKKFTLKRGETIHYVITEVDPENDAKYDAENPTDFWKEFTPSNGTGIIEGDVDGSKAVIELNGVNKKNYHGWLTIKKEVGEDNDWQQGERFYFIVKDKDGNNVTQELFDSDKLELNYDKQSATSEEVIWRNKGDAPTYKVTEVDYDKDLYEPVEESKEITLIENDIDVKFDEAKIAEISGYGTFVNNRITIKNHGWMVITKDAPEEYWLPEEEFGFKVYQNGKDVTKSLYNVDTVVLTVDNKEATSNIVEWKENESAPTYIVKEVDYDKEKWTPQAESIQVTLKEIEASIELTEENKTTTAVYAGFVNESNIIRANLILSKQVDGDWADGVEYEFDIYINDDNKLFDTAKFDKENQTWNSSKTLEWKSTEKAPKVMFKEKDNPDVEITINGTPIKSGEWYQLENEDDRTYTFTAVNHNEKEANLTIVKKAPSGDDEYTFGYEYSLDDGANWSDTYTIKVKANSPGEQTETVKWNSNKPTPLFRVWEISEGLESITATNAGTTQKFKENGKTIIQGKLNPDAQVTVTAKNGPTHQGSVYVVKEFADSELKDRPMTDILEEVKAYYKKQGKYEFEFNLKIYYENSNDKFTYFNEETQEKEERNELTITKIYDIDYMIENYSKEGIDVISPVGVSWSGESAPMFTVTEKSKVDGKEIKGCFFEGNVIDGTAAQLVEGDEPVKVRVINNYDHFTRIKIDLTTSLAGDVWIDNKEDGKTITSNSKKDDGETAASNVYVVPYRCLVDAENNIIAIDPGEQGAEKLGINSANNKFILDKLLDKHDKNDEPFYYYIAEGQDKQGHWEFEKVKITAFDLGDPQELAWYNQGYKLKYYVEFYYDGMEYEAVTPLVDDNSDNPDDDYIKLNPGFEKYFDNSTATEVGRDEYNSEYATVEGRDIMDPETGKSTGVIKDASGEKVTTTVDYSTKIIGNLDGTNIIRTTTTGEVNTKKLNEINTIDDLRNNFMCSSTEATGLLYFFLNEFDDVDVEATLGDKELTLSGNPRRGIAKDSDGRDKVVFEYNNPVRVDYVPVEYAQHINLGLIEREQANVQIDKKIETATVIINDKKFTYSYNNTVNYDENFTEALAPFIREIKNADELYKMMQNDVEKNKKELNIYTSDYYYRTSMYDGTEVKDALDKFYNAIYQTGDEEVPDAIKTRELQIYLTYSITVQNQSGVYGVRINSIDDYYDSRLTFVDVGEGYAADVDGIEKYTEYTNGQYKSGLWAYVEQDGKEEKRLTNVLERKDSEGTIIDDYYNANSTFTGEKEVTDKYSINNEFNKRTFRKQFDLSANEDRIFYVTYRVNDVQFDYIDADGNRYTPPYNNVAEIASFTPYETDEDGNFIRYAAVIDKTSAPGNYNIADEKTKYYMEDDTDLANVQFKIPPTIPTPRTISGTAWLENKEDNDEGKSKLTDKDYNISGLNTKLVEVIDLPIRKAEDGELVYDENNYTEYEFYWKGNETTTDEYGTYTFKDYIDSDSSEGNGGVIRDSLVPGNYVVRFFYGDKDTELYARSEEIDTSKKIININGEDYKTTAYEIGDHDKGYINNEWHEMSKVDETNRARDNEARRLQIIKETQTLTNSNTAIFDVANYADADAYAREKTYQAMISGIIPMLKNESDDNIIDLSYYNNDYYNKQKEAYNTYIEKLYGTSNEDGIKSSDITNGSTAYKDLIYKDGYSMFADTAKMNLKVEDQAEKYGEDVTKDIQPGGISFNNVNLGLEERPRTKMYLDKQAEEITLTTSAGKTFFHVAYDFDYVVEKVDDVSKIGKEPKETNNGYEYNLIDYDKDDKLAVWVGLKPQGEVIGVNNLQALNDNMTPTEARFTAVVGDQEVEYSRFQKIITQGFRYINIDSTVLQGLKLDIRYRFTAINLSETDKYGKGLYEIIKYIDEDGNENNWTYIERAENFDNAIEALSSPKYTLVEKDDELLLSFSNKYTNDNSTKRYGEYLGHTYYQGTDEHDEDKTVTTKPRQIVDYIDNDIEFDVLANPTWATEENDYEQLKGRVDEFVFADGKVQNEAEVEYKTIATSIDSDETNVEFVKELNPINGEETIKYDTIKDGKGTSHTTISTSKVFAGTDKGNTGMDNFAEFFVIENTVGRRDVSTVHGNYDPRGGYATTTERDETATEIVTLSPPTGNEENDRTMLVVISIICTIALASGTAVGLKIKFSGKSKSKTE